MSGRCTKCGEELLGAVNRCWRCGEVTLPPAPPVRVASEPAVVTAQTAEPSEPPKTDRPLRVGSPFATADDAPPVRRVVSRSGSNRRAWALGGGFAALILGVISLLALWSNPIGPLFTSSLGLLLGIWGLYAERRGPAVIGLFLCCITLAIAGFLTVVEIYTHVKGVSPFEVLSPPLGN